jgi:hypothetical protein
MRTNAPSTAGRERAKCPSVPNLPKSSVIAVTLGNVPHSDSDVLTIVPNLNRIGYRKKSLNIE